MELHKKSTQKIMGVITVAMLGFVPAMAEASATAPVYGPTPERLRAIVGGIIGIASIIIAIRARRTALQTGTKRSGPVIAFLFGLLSMTLSTIHLANTTGGFGTGKGRAGAIISLILGLIGTILSWLAMARFRHAAKKP